ncbi:unannotated protein [freshwater metagenome]|uniref:Unannotated protein n=1 Tax=freshwater metagenome TaxID=449393 RepID=A0A6J6U2Y8_9ZZZZ
MAERPHDVVDGLTQTLSEHGRIRCLQSAEALEDRLPDLVGGPIVEQFQITLGSLLEIKELVTVGNELTAPGVQPAHLADEEPQDHDDDCLMADRGRDSEDQLRRISQPNEEQQGT